MTTGDKLVVQLPKSETKALGEIKRNDAVRLFYYPQGGRTEPLCLIRYLRHLPLPSGCHLENIVLELGDPVLDSLNTRQLGIPHRLPCQANQGLADGTVIPECLPPVSLPRPALDAPVDDNVERISGNLPMLTDSYARLPDLRGVAACLRGIGAPLVGVLPAARFRPVRQHWHGRLSYSRRHHGCRCPGKP
jgi:hypothetical protein